MLDTIKFKMGEWFPKSQKSKNLLKAIMCFVTAIIITASIFVSQQAKSTVITVVKPAKIITEGSRIKESDLVTVEVGEYGLPKEALKNINLIVGKYAGTDIYPTDYITAVKLTDKKFQPFRTIKENERIMSFTVPTLAASVASNINVGDKIQVMYSEAITEQRGIEREALITAPECLNSLEVIDIKDANGYTRGQEKTEGAKSYEVTPFVPSVITVIVNNEQAAELYKAEQTKSIYAVFIKR